MNPCEPKDLISFLFPNLRRAETSRFVPFFQENVANPTKQRRQKAKQRGSLFISRESILSDADTRTSIMVKNLPTQTTGTSIINVLKSICDIDYLYLPINQATNKLLGFAFLNVVEHKQIINLFDMLNGKFIEGKKIEVCYSKLQGCNRLMKSFGKENCIKC